MGRVALRRFRMTRDATARLRPYDPRMRWLGLLLVAVLVTVGLLLAGAKETKATGACPYMGFWMYEDGYPFTGDATKVCSPTLIPVNAARSNFNVNPANADLTDGCNAGLFSHSTWNDCLSGVQVLGLPSGFKFVIYLNANYSVPVFCTDTNGTNSYSLAGVANDSASSARMLAGDC